MQFTKQRLQELAGILKEGEVIDLRDFRREKERANYKMDALISIDGSTVSRPEDWVYIVFTHRDQVDAVIDGDVVRAQELGAKFFNVSPGDEEKEVKNI